jgi:hypothetical protein
VLNISESIQGFHVKIVDLEACTMPSTPPKEREQREKTMMTTIESIKSLEESVPSCMKKAHKYGLS